MRTDPKKGEDFVQSEDWIGELLDLNFVEKQEEGIGPHSRINSLSGGERNRLFLAQNGYADISLLSGLDCQEDGRGFTLWDFDEDGFQDIALISPQSPRVRVFRNEIAKNMGVESSRIALKLIGGNHSSVANDNLSNRDAAGAVVTVMNQDGRKRVFQKSIGEGFSSQNSGWIWIGMGLDEKASHIEIRWPSGKKQILKDVPTASKIQINEVAD